MHLPPLAFAPSGLSGFLTTKGRTGFASQVLQAETCASVLHDPKQQWQSFKPPGSCLDDMEPENHWFVEEATLPKVHFLLPA